MGSFEQSSTLNLPQPYLLFLGEETQDRNAKTAFGLRDWARDQCVGEWSMPAATVTTGLPRVAPALAYSRGARSLVIGIAVSGGQIPSTWIPTLTESLEAGLDLISGMHTRLQEVPQLAELAARDTALTRDAKIAAGSYWASILAKPPRRPGSRERPRSR